MMSSSTIHKDIDTNWDEPDKIIEKITAENAKQTDENGMLPLHQMFYIAKDFNVGHLQIVKKLMTLYPEGVKHQANDGDLPIQNFDYSHHSVENCSDALMEAIKLLLTAYPESLSVQDNDYGLVPLRSERAFKHLTRYLMENYPQWLQIEDGDRSIPLHTAAWYGDVDAMKLCLDAYPEGLKRKTKFGSLPIHCATMGRAGDKAVSFLISKDPESVKMKDNDGPCKDRPNTHYITKYCLFLPCMIVRG